MDLVDELPSQLKDVSVTTFARIKLEVKLEEKLERDTYVIK